MRRPLASLPARPNPTDSGDAADLSDRRVVWEDGCLDSDWLVGSALWKVVAAPSFVFSNYRTEARKQFDKGRLL